MSKKVKIPECANPFEVNLNGKKYFYPAGQEVEVPDDVAAIIEAHNKKHQPVEHKHDAPFPVGSGGGVDVTASVGQTIVVEEVDANGKPTKWKAADYQPRTHWSEDGLVQVSLFPKYRTSLDSSLGVFNTVLAFNEYVDGNLLTSIHTVKFDGVEYGNLATAQVGEYIFFGNLYYLNQMYGTSFPNTGEPFLISSVYRGTQLLTPDTAPTEHSVEIYINRTYHHRIDQYYIPRIPVIDLTPYYTSIEYDETLEITGDDYYEKVYTVLCKNDMVRFIYRLEGGRFATASGFPFRFADGATIWVATIGMSGFGLDIRAWPTAASIYITP